MRRSHAIIKEEDLEDGFPYAEAGAPYPFSKKVDGYLLHSACWSWIIHHCSNKCSRKDVYVVGIMGIVSVKFQKI
jgi:hypothetical protein